MRIVNLTIESVAFGGRGVARKGGKAIFVPFTIDGETVSARLVREKKQFAEAEVVDLQQSSPYRVEPQCRYFGRCGGCSYQHIEYEHQLAIKWHQVRDLLQRIGKLKFVPMRPIVPSPSSYAYRNRITVHVENGVIGYFQRDSHRLIDVEECPIAMEEANRELAQLRAQHPRDGHYTLRAQSGPRVFSQTNDGVANLLGDLVAQLIPEQQKLLIDAYCGAGFFAKSLRDKFEKVIGIDWDRFAIEEARKNAAEKETYVAGDLEVELNNFLKRSSGARAASSSQIPRDSTLIVDPPATGLSAAVRKLIVDLEPATLLYVSCNPATLARDLSELQRRFKIESITPLDMFPQTAEIEAVAHLRRSDDSAI